MRPIYMISLPSHLNNKMTLREILTLISPTDGVAKPKLIPCQQSGAPIAVCTVDCYRMSVYKNGFAVVELIDSHINSKYCVKDWRVLRMDRFSNYHFAVDNSYLSKDELRQQEKNNRTIFTYEQALDTPWPVSVLLVIEDALFKADSVQYDRQRCDNDTNSNPLGHICREHMKGSFDATSDAQRYREYERRERGAVIEETVEHRTMRLKAMSVLTDNQRRAYELWYNGYTVSEATEMLGLKKWAYWDRVRTAKRKIGDYLLTHWDTANIYRNEVIRDICSIFQEECENRK